MIRTMFSVSDYTLMNTSPSTVLLILTFLMTMYLLRVFLSRVIVCYNLMQEHAI